MIYLNNFKKTVPDRRCKIGCRVLEFADLIEVVRYMKSHKIKHWNMLAQDTNKKLYQVNVGVDYTVKYL